jgi:phosphatidylserine decarboxylase
MLRTNFLWISILFLIISLALLLFIISFFRIPSRKLTIDEGLVIAPADGKVVVIEEAIDDEYFKGKRLQVSIFMSPLNVHVNLMQGNTWLRGILNPRPKTNDIPW